MATFPPRGPVPSADGISPRTARGAGRDNRRAWQVRLIRPHAGRLAAVLLLSLALSAVGLAQPWLTKLLIDDGLLAGRLDLVAWSCALLLAAALLSAGLGAVNRWHYVGLSGAVLFALRERLFRHLQRLPPTFYAARPAGDVLARLDGDVAELQRFAVDGVLAAVNAVLVLAGALAVMAWMSPGLTVLAFIVLPAQLLVLALLRPRIERLTRALRQRAGALTGFFVDNLAHMKLVQASRAEDRECRRLGALNRAYLDDLRRAELAGHAAAALPGLLGGVATAAVFLAGGAMVIEGAMTVGALVAFTAYLARASGPVNTLLGLWVGQKRARVSLERVLELLDRPAAVADPASPRDLPADARGSLIIEDVHFAYGGQPVLEGAAALLPGGAKVGVVGVSGAGKSTLIDLLHRHYDPQAGRILLDGIDLRDLALDELRRRVAVVAQDAALMPGSVADNIRYAAPEADDGAVRRAAGMAQVDFADLDAPVGERGAALSGGQRQRLALARAILQDPLVLILDEATTGIDGEGERRIVEALDRLFADRTRIVVSHHARSLAGLDAVYVLENGRLHLRRLESAA